MQVGTWVTVHTPFGKSIGVVESIDTHSEQNNWRKDPENYPIIVRLKKPCNIFGRKINYITYDWQGFSTKWERVARINQLEIYK